MSLPALALADSLHSEPEGWALLAYSVLRQHLDSEAVLAAIDVPQVQLRGVLKAAAGRKTQRSRRPLKKRIVHCL